jgi:hypothetical protein
MSVCKVKCSVSMCVGLSRYEKENKHVLPERLASCGGSTAFPWARFTSCSIALRVSLPTRDEMGMGHSAFVRQSVGEGYMVSGWMGSCFRFFFFVACV